MKNSKHSIVGCGYIGKQLASQLLKKNLTVNAFVNSESSLDECRKKNINAKIINFDTSLPDTAIDTTDSAIIYLVPPPSSGKTDTRITNFLQALDELALKKQTPKKLVLISTTGVYGNCNGAWVDETAPIKPNADRAYRRVDAEQQTQDFCQQHNIPLVILRVPGIYGPNKIPLARIKSGQPIVSQEDSPFTNRIHAFDLVNICEQALRDKTITGIYNVGDGTPGTMYDYFTGVAKAMDLPLPPTISLADAQQQLSAGMLSYMAESRRISNKKLLKDFSLTLKYPNLQAGLIAID